MAAMNQDCAQCRLRCQRYSDALLARKGQRLTSCTPAGGGTMHKALHRELSSLTPASAPMRAAIPPADAMAAPVAAPGCSRERQRFLSRTRRNKRLAGEETYRAKRSRRRRDAHR